MPDNEPDAPPPTKGKPHWVLALLASIILLTGGAFYLQSRSLPKPGLPADAVKIGGAFTLIAADGKPFSDAQLRGKPFAIFFGYTRCPDVCPTTLARMAGLRQKLGNDAMKFNIVFVSVDPTHDKPAEIGHYVGLFGTPIIGLTGSDAQLQMIKDEYHVYVQKVPQPGGDFLIDHSAMVYLMDRNGTYADIINFQEPDNSALAKLKLLIG